MSVNLGRSDAEVAAVIDAFDALVAALERHVESLEGEVEQATASGDPRYVRRVTRGLEWSRALLGVLDDDVLERIMGLRHNARQLGTARDGKMV